MISASVIMPEGLEDFPWKNLLHMWDYDYYSHALRLKLWYLAETEDARDYCRSAFLQHLAVWQWLEERCTQVRVPEFETEGEGRIDSDGQQIYKRVAIWGTFYLDPPHSSSRT